MTGVARRRGARSAAGVMGQDLRVLVQDAADDPAVFVRLADESGTIPAAWCIGNGRPGASRIRRAVHDRVMHLEDNDRGIFHSAGDHVVLTIQGPARSVPRRSIAELGRASTFPGHDRETMRLRLVPTAQKGAGMSP